jgi:signal peptide peptidase SppA
MINNILSTPFWLMESNYLKQFLENIQSQDMSEAIIIEASEYNKKISVPKSYRVEDNIAFIDIKGPLLKRVPWVLSLLFGIQSMESIGNAFNAALSDKKIDGIFLYVDSPGSEVSGVQTLSDIIFKGREKKPILSYIDGSGTSGAFWIASSANQIILADETSRVGSVGIIGTHMELSEAAKKAGVGIHVFSAGKFKAVGNRFEKLSEKDIEYINNQFSYLHQIFISGVEKNLGRKLSQEAREARIYIGKQAIEAGLTNAIMNKDKALNRLKSMAGSRSNTTYKTAKAKDNIMYANHNLLDFVKLINGIDNLDELRKTEENLHSEIKRRKVKASNWIEQRDVKSLKDSIIKLIDQQRLMIQSTPKAEKVRQERELGQAVGRGVLGYN